MFVTILILLLVIAFLTLKGVWLGIAVGVLGAAFALIVGLFLYCMYMVNRLF